MPLSIPSEIDFCVVSSGGVGSKMLVKALKASSHLHRTGEREIIAAHSHLRVPPKIISANTRILYMFGDPRDAVVSFFDRRKSKHDRHGFNTKIIDKPNIHWVLQHCDNIESQAFDMDETWDLHKFLGNGLDYFKLEEHFDNWFYSNMDYNIVFVRYENIWDNVKALGKTLQLNIDHFPDKIERRSKWRNLDSTDKTRCNEIYGSFSERMNKLPDIFTVRLGSIMPCSYL